jgi:hypothetical protein
MTFGMVIEGYSQEAAQRAAKSFIAGRVPGHEARFCPSCAQFAGEIARQQGFIDAANALPKPAVSFKKSKWLQEYEAARGICQSQPQNQTADSEQTALPQERERVAEKMRQLAAQLQREAEANPNSRHYAPDGKTAAVEKYELPYDGPGQINMTPSLAAYFERNPSK